MQKRNGRNVKRGGKSGVSVAWLLSVMLLFAACSQREIQPAITIQFKTDDVSSTSTLDGAEVSGTIHVVLPESGNLTAVRFFLNTASGGVAQLEPHADTQAPFEWTLDTTVLADAPHTLMVMGVKRNQEWRLGEVSFTVRNSVPAPLPGDTGGEPAPVTPPGEDEGTPDEGTPDDGTPEPDDDTEEPGDAPGEGTEPGDGDTGSGDDEQDEDGSAPEPTDPEPQPTPDPEPQPTPVEPVQRYALRGDSSFSVQSLGREERLWYDRLWAGIRNPQQYPNMDSRANSDNIYHYGRDLHTHLQMLLMVFGVTGDLRLLDEVDRLTQIMRSKLHDSWRGTLDGTDGTRDGYLNWVDRKESGSLRGKDISEVNEMRTHAIVAQVAWAFQNNRDLQSPAGVSYGERADFWRDYLVNHFEAKWRERERKPWPQFPFLERNGMPSQMNWIRYHYYMGRLTGKAEYTREARRLSDEMFDLEFRETPTKLGPAYVWHATRFSASGGSRHYLQPSTYVRYILADVTELHLEGFYRWGEASHMPKFANTLSQLMMDNGATDFARDVGGGVARAGIAASPEGDWDRMRITTYDFGPYMMVAPWDSSGKILSISEQVYHRRESNLGNPQRMFIPAGMFLTLRYNR